MIYIINFVLLKKMSVFTGTDGFSIALTHRLDSTEHERTVSVRPSRNNRVIDASYVKLNRPESYEWLFKIKKRLIKNQCMYSIMS